MCRALTMKMEDLTGKVTVVTGASSGIGEAAARLLAAEGVHVFLSSRRRERIEALAEELGDKATAVIADVADVDQM
jgi:NADP-dependent 3-hydroxy acid dehydrogenase YdfG